MWFTSGDVPYLPPSPHLLIGEWLVLMEVAMLPAALPLLAAAPRGEDHPVLILPGFFAGDWSTLPLRLYLDWLGYHTYPWDMGQNMGPNLRVATGLYDLVDRIYEKHQRKITIVGWSLGGAFARMIAQKRPNKVRQIITMGSPIKHIDATWATPFVRWMADGIDQELVSLVERPLPVPGTAIYSRGDGIVDYRCCLQEEGPFTENIEVPGQHMGYGFRPTTMLILADRLAQPEDDWQPYQPSGLGWFGLSGNDFLRKLGMQVA